MIWIIKIKTKFLISIILIISISLSCGCLNNKNNEDEEEDKNENEYGLINEKVEISNIFQDINNNTTSYDFDFQIIWKNLPDNISEIAIKIVFIKNEETYLNSWSRWMVYNDSSHTQEFHKDKIVKGIIPMPDKYIMELYWGDEDSNYKEFLDLVEKNYQQ